MLTRQVVLSFCSPPGAELEPQPPDSHLLAQCVHAGGLPEGLRRAAHPQIPPENLHTNRTGMLFVCFSFQVNSKWVFQ